MIQLRLIVLGLTVVGAIGYAVYKHFSTEEKPRQHYYSYNNDMPNSDYSGRSTPSSASSGSPKGNKKKRPVKCSICLRHISWFQKDCNTTLQCGHEFHTHCIESWFDGKCLRSCPNCRAKAL